MNFEQLGIEEKKLLLRAYNYDVDEEGIIVDRLLNERVFSIDTQRVVTLENASLIPGSLKVVDTTPLTISKLLRELAIQKAENK